MTVPEVDVSSMLNATDRWDAKALADLLSNAYGFGCGSTFGIQNVCPLLRYQNQGLLSLMPTVAMSFRSA